MDRDTKKNDKNNNTTKKQLTRNKKICEQLRHNSKSTIKSTCSHGTVRYDTVAIQDASSIRGEHFDALLAVRSKNSTK